MSEPKRVVFSTLSSSVTGAGAGASSGNGVISSSTTAAALHRFGAPDPVTSLKSSSSSGGSGAKPAKTIRLNMELSASNSNSFPEFNYSKLIHLEKKKLKKLKSKQNGFSDPFMENDDDVERIAKELEKKYGTSYASGRGRSKKDDFCDIGLGYDETDSFIDNTEAYDEIIPEEVETVEGGFYINSGALEFKHLSSTEKTDEIIKMPNKPRKRVLTSSSEETGSSEEEAEETESATVAATNPPQSTNPKVSKQKTSSHSEKRPKTNSDKENSDKEKSTKSKSSVSNSASAASSVTVSASASPKDEEPNSEVVSKDKSRAERAVKTTTVKDMLKAKRDSFLKMQEEELKTKTSNGEVKAPTSAEDRSGSDSSSDDSDSNEEPSSKKLKKTSEEDADKLRQTDTKLPSELSDEIFKDIQDLKDTAKSSNRTGKKFQFDDKLTELFLRIDEACLCLDKNVRNVVFAHLEFQLSLPKYYLLRKAKQLRINQEKTKTKKAFVKLRKAVAEIMPTIIQQYQSNTRTYEDFLALHPGADVHKLENAPKMPKKRFAWNDSTRTLLYDLYQVRWMSYTVLRTRKESFEDFVANFLKDKVINIWPSGWMKYEELKREIEKKKNVPKKLKENKKPDESTDTHPVEKPGQDTTAMISGTKMPLNATDIYGMSSSSDLISGNMKPNELAKLLPAHSNATSEHIHSSKTYSSSGKVHRSSTNSPLNLCSGQSHVKTEKSSSGSMTNNNNNANPNQNLSNNRSSGNVNNPKTVVDLVSPSKRTDHSINSIMSSPSSTSSSVSTTPQPQHSAAMGNTLTVDNNTHVINIDNFKSATEIINTSNQLINHTSKSQSTERLKNRSAADMHSHTHPQFSAESVRRDSSSESDGVEIVGVYQARSSTSSLPPIVKNKYKKSSHQDRDSPSLNDKVKIQSQTAASKKAIDSTDLDVNKIMKALKELEELQQTGNFVPDISSFTNSNHNANTSPLAYGKDLTQ